MKKLQGFWPWIFSVVLHSLVLLLSLNFAGMVGGGGGSGDGEFGAEDPVNIREKQGTDQSMSIDFFLPEDLPVSKNYTPPDEGSIDDLVESTNGYYGIGIYISTISNQPYPDGGFHKIAPAAYIINTVVPGYPAYYAGLEAGDIIVQVDGKNITSQRDIKSLRPEPRTLTVVKSTGAVVKIRIVTTWISTD